MKFCHFRGQEENIPLLTSPTVRFMSDQVWSMSVDGKISLELFPTVWRGVGRLYFKVASPHFEKLALTHTSCRI
jgi:hypothetical protein